MEDPKTSKPQVLLLGNSHLNDIRNDKLSKGLSVDSKKAGSVNEAETVIKGLKSKPDAIVLQVITNEARGNSSVPDIVNRVKTLIANTKCTRPKAKIFLSQAPCKFNSSRISTRISAINNSLAAEFYSSDVICINNDGIRPFNFQRDEIHLTKYGTSNLAFNMKSELEYYFKIGPEHRYRAW